MTQEARVRADDAELVSRARTLAATFADRATSYDRSGTFPFANFDALHTAGLLSLTVPVALGGQGVRLSTVCPVVQEIAAGDASTALVLSQQYLSHAGLARRQRWPRAIYERSCREAVSGITLLNALRVEPEFGSPARGGLPSTMVTPTAVLLWPKRERARRQRDEGEGARRGYNRPPPASARSATCEHRRPLPPDPARLPGYARDHRRRTRVGRPL